MSNNMDTEIPSTPTIPTAKVYAEPLMTGTAVELEPDEEGFCCVCKEGDGTEDNPIVFCDSCDMSVHKECYGNPLVIKIPDESWICERCRWGMSNKENNSNSNISNNSSNNNSNNNNSNSNHHYSSCALCPVRSGAMKRTTDFQWVHLMCAQWIPEVFFRYPEGRECIDILYIPRKRYNQICCYCKQQCGACVECSYPHCGLWFHVTCGVANQVYLEYKPSTNGADVIVSYCKEHGKRWQNKRSGKVSKKE